MSYLIVGDLHIGKGMAIGKPQPGQLNSRIQDQINLLNWVDELSDKNNITEIFFTGDIFQDPKPHPTIIGIFISFIKKITDKKKKAHIVRGNHDILRTGALTSSALDLVGIIEIPLAAVYNKISIYETDDSSFLMIPYIDKRMYDVKTTQEGLLLLREEISTCYGKMSANKKKIVIGHMSLDGALSIGDEISDNLNELFLAADFFTGFDYVWLGHIHHPQVIQEKDNGQPHIAHIGSLDRSDFAKREIENNKIVVEVKPGEWPEFIEHIIPTRPLRHIEIKVPDNKDSTEFVINSLCVFDKEKPLKNAIIKLEIVLNGEGLENVNRQKVETFVYDKLEGYHISSLSEIRLTAPLKIKDEDLYDQTMSVQSTIDKWSNKLEEDDRVEFKKFVLECLQELEDKKTKKDQNNEIN